MKAIVMNAILGGVAGKVDGSLSLRFSTPELNPEAKLTIFELQNKNVELLIQPTDGPAEGLVKVAKELEGKTPSQRLHAVIFLFWKQQKSDTEKDFNAFYLAEMGRIIDKYKSQLEPAPF